MTPAQTEKWGKLRCSNPYFQARIKGLLAILKVDPETKLCTLDQEMVHKVRVMLTDAGDRMDQLANDERSQRARERAQRKKAAGYLPGDEEHVCNDGIGIYDGDDIVPNH